MWRASLCAVVIAGCGRVGFDDQPRADAADTPIDAPMFPSCDELVVVPVPTSGQVSGTIGATGSIAQGTCAGDTSDEDIYSLDVTVPGSMLQIAADSGAEDEFALYVRTECASMAAELDCDRTDGVGESPLINLPVPVGRYFVFVDGQPGAIGGPYDATMRVLLPAGAACTQNNERDICGPSLGCMAGTCQPESCASAFVLGGASPFTATADTRALPNLHGGSCGTGGDGGARGNEMIYRLDLASPIANMVVSTDDPDTDFDTLVYVRAGCNGAEVVCDDDSGAERTSRASTGPLAAGTYFIFIDAFGPQSGSADVTITLTP